MRNHLVVTVAIPLLAILLINYYSIFLNSNIGKTPVELITENLRRARLVQINKSIDYWQSQLRNYPHFRDIYLKLAQLSFERGDSNTALKFIDEGLMLDPNYSLSKKLVENIKTTL